MHEWWKSTRIAGWTTLLLAGASACIPQGGGGTGGAPQERPRSAIEVLLADSLHLITARTLVVIHNNIPSNRDGTPTSRLLREDKRAQRAGVRVVSAVDSADLILVDLQDDGSRSSAALRTFYSTLQRAVPRKTQIVLLDRPNPLTGSKVEGPTPPRDTTAGTQRTSNDPADILGLPFRHGLTLGEMARVLHERTAPEVPLAIVPVFGWRRPLWPNQTRLPYLGDGSLALSRTVLSPLVAMEGVDVGEGTGDAWRHVAAPWLDPRAVLRLLQDREPPGVRFSVESVEPSRGGRTLPAIRITVTDRERIQTGRLAATLVWAIKRVHGDAVRVDTAYFDAAIGSSVARRALLAGTDPDEVMDRELTASVNFSRESRRVMLYR